MGYVGHDLVRKELRVLDEGWNIQHGSSRDAMAVENGEELPDRPARHPLVDFPVERGGVLVSTCAIPVPWVFEQVLALHRSDEALPHLLGDAFHRDVAVFGAVHIAGRDIRIAVSCP